MTCQPTNEAFLLAQKRYAEIEADVRERLKVRAAGLGISLAELEQRFANRSRTGAVTRNRTGAASYCTKRNLMELARLIDENNLLRRRSERMGLPVPFPRWPSAAS